MYYAPQGLIALQRINTQRHRRVTHPVSILRTRRRHEMRETRVNKGQIEFNKTLGQSQKDASIKGCLRGGDEQAGCSGKIVQTHSIPRGKFSLRSRRAVQGRFIT